MSAIESMPVVREAVWLYAEGATVRVRVLSSVEAWGTGDYEDDESVAENRPIPCFFLAYEAAGSPGTFCNLIPNIESLESAVSLAEQKFPGIKWEA